MSALFFIGRSIICGCAGRTSGFRPYYCIITGLYLINQLSYFNDGQNNRNDTIDYIENYRRKGSSNLNIAINPGIGLSFRLSDQFNAVIKYDLLIGLTNSGKNLSGYSVLGGLKYSF